MQQRFSDLEIFLELSCMKIDHLFRNRQMINLKSIALFMIKCARDFSTMENS